VRGSERKEEREKGEREKADAGKEEGAGDYGADCALMRRWRGCRRDRRWTFMAAAVSTSPGG